MDKLKLIIINNIISNNIKTNYRSYFIDIKIYLISKWFSRVENI